VRVGVLVAIAIILLVEPAFAVEEAGHGAGFPWIPWVTSVVNFAIFAALIYKFAGGSISEFFRGRRDALIENLDQARVLREEAEARLEEYSARLDALEGERQELLEEYHLQGEREKKRIIEDAKRQIDKMRADAEISIDQEVKKAVASLERQVVAQAVARAEVLAGDKLDADRQKSLLEEYVRDLGAMDAADDSDRAA
jgi:F-type H+-transporting ATPase subunit b